MKVMVQGIKNGDYIKIFEATAITYESNGTPRLHRRRGESFVLSTDCYKIISIT